MASRSATCVLEIRSSLGEGPLWHMAAPAFGGAELKTLYITGAAGGIGDAPLEGAPLSGSLFACEPGVSALPEPSFAG